MTTPIDMLDKLRKAQASLTRDTEKILRSLETEIINLNRVDQLFNKGAGTDGGLIGVYSKATESISKGISGPGFPKRAGAPYNFLDSGSMFNSYSLKIGKDVFTIVNTSLSLDLFLETTRLKEVQIIGLTEEIQGKVNWELVMPKLREFFNNHIS